MELEDIKITEVEEIIDTYYSAVCESQIVKDTFGKKTGRQFDEEEIKEILEDAKCKNPYDVPFGIIVNKYYEDVDLKANIENSDRHIVKLLKSMIKWQTQGNSQSERLMNDMRHELSYLLSLRRTHRGRKEFDKYYSPLKNIFYSKAIKHVVNESFSYREFVRKHNDGNLHVEGEFSIVNYNLIRDVLINSFTSKVKYPMPEIYDLTKLTMNSLNDFIIDNSYSREVPNIVSHNTDVDSIKRITLEEAISDFPKKEIDTIIATAQRFYNISNFNSYGV